MNQFFKKIYIISSFSTQERIPNLVDDINYELMYILNTMTFI